MALSYSMMVDLPGANLACTPPRAALNLTTLALLALLLLTQQAEDGWALLPSIAALQLSRCCMMARAIQVHDKLCSKDQSVCKG